MKYINVPIFLISFAVGVYFVYSTTSSLKDIPVFPTPDNIKKVQYVDKASNCFEFDAMKVACNKDSRDFIVQ